MSVKNSSSAQKRDRQSEKRRISNRMYTTRVKTQAKKLLGLIGDKDREAAEREYKHFSAYVDKAVKKGVFQKNKGARKKSRMQKKINTLV